MLKKVFESLIYNSITKKIADYYRNTFQIDFQRNHLLDEINQNIAKILMKIFLQKFHHHFFF